MDPFSYYSKEKNEVRSVFQIGCECNELDDCVTDLVGFKLPENERIRKVLDDVQDRMRIPWLGGAKKLDPDLVYLFTTGYIFYKISSWRVFQSFWGTIVLILAFSIQLGVTHLAILKIRSKSKFPLMLLAILIVIFYIEAEKSLGILMPFFQAAVLRALFVVMAYALWSCFSAQFRKSTETKGIQSHSQPFIVPGDPPAARTLMKHRGINANTRLCCQKCNPGFSSVGWVVLGEDSTKSIRDAEELNRGMSWCSICKGYIRLRDHHCIWVGTCVGSQNQVYFVVFLILFVTLALWYSTRMLILASNSLTQSELHSTQNFLSIPLKQAASAAATLAQSRPFLARAVPAGAAAAPPPRALQGALLAAAAALPAGALAAAQVKRLVFMTVSSKVSGAVTASQKHN